MLSLNQRLEQQDHSEWIEKVMTYKEKYPLRYPESGLSGPFMIEEIYKQTQGDAIMVTEVGQHQMWAAQFYKYSKPRTLITSGGLGTMGYGLGAAIGAQMANPDKQVINIAGDGCFRMNMNEMATAVRQKLPLIQVVVNNHVLGMVRQWQTLFYEQHYSATILNDRVDFVKVAEAMGAIGIRATTRSRTRCWTAQTISLLPRMGRSAIAPLVDLCWISTLPWRLSVTPALRRSRIASPRRFSRIR